jgi:hypothetical protein
MTEVDDTVEFDLDWSRSVHVMENSAAGALGFHDKRGWQAHCRAWEHGPHGWRGTLFLEGPAPQHMPYFEAELERKQHELAEHPHWATRRDTTPWERMLHQQARERVDGAALMKGLRPPWHVRAGRALRAFGEDFWDSLRGMGSW